jgi:hypothetical protein
MPSFSSTPVTLNNAATLTYDAPSASWAFGSRSLLRAGVPVVPPENLGLSFQVGAVTVGPTGSSALLTFSGTWWRWVFSFLSGTYTLVLKIMPDDQTSELTVQVPLAWQVSASLILGETVAIRTVAGSVNDLTMRFLASTRLSRALRRR